MKKNQPTAVSWYLFFVTLFLIALQLLMNNITSYFADKANEFAHTVIIQFVAILLPAAIYIFSHIDEAPHILPSAKLGKPLFWTIVALSVCGQFVGQIFNAPIKFFLIQIGASLPVNTITPDSLPKFFLSILVFSLLPAFSEELLFRSIVLGAYRKVSDAAAIFMSAFLFSLFHQDITNFLGTFVIGLFFGYVFVKTKSIFAAILAHFVTNATGIVFVYVVTNLPFFNNPWAMSLAFAVMIAAIVPLFVIFNSLCDSKTPIAQKHYVSDLARLSLKLPILLIVLLYFFLQILRMRAMFG